MTFGEIPPQPEIGAYHSRLRSILKKTSKKDGSEFRVWTFAVEDAEIVLVGTTSLALGQDSKAHKWATALLGREPTKGETLDTLLEKRCIVQVGRKPNGYAEIDVKPATTPATSSPLPTPTESQDVDVDEIPF